MSNFNSSKARGLFPLPRTRIRNANRVNPPAMVGVGQAKPETFH